MQEVVVYIIVLVVVALTVRYALKRLKGKGLKQQGACSGCPLKENCGKRIGEKGTLKSGRKQCEQQNQLDIK